MDVKENYESLRSQYKDPNSLMFKKLRIVDNYIEESSLFLDVGVGTGELINLEKNKFKKIYGIDIDNESIAYCKKRFEKDTNINILLNDLRKLKSLFEGYNFDVITCLDVLEHIDEASCEELLDVIHDNLKENGLFIFSGPGIFEKIKIILGLSPTHVHSHSSYSWAEMIRRSNFNLISIESVEFPVLKSDFLRKNAHIFGKCCIITARKG